ncbi:hypothetical protein C8A05DRAFT_31918 [Staphylotrichum tortipilum]|uniref:Uncharacterized protein n=1 Tax=Staphylotrichum tortipilum TaxID=2831512 RepID=A0AAN6MNR4_9PEZI|nr:hypothetical protein C8A05DRAFT_31918 [Staphylotrichum longicolle]
MSTPKYSPNAIPAAPPPPPDLGTYTRSMHLHTKRQMESIAQPPPPPPPARSVARRPPSPTGMPEAAQNRDRDAESLGLRKRAS